MHILSGDGSELGSAPGRDSDIRDPDERALDRFLERLSDEGCSTLVRWARRHAPDLLHALIISFLTRAPSSELRKTAVQSLLPETSSMTAATTSSTAATLRAIEQQHIARVIADSRTLHEAASRLGVAETTLWRKRKIYALRPEAIIEGTTLTESQGR